MAVELEEKVMREIGLGNHYSWFNGSGSCGYIRRDAVANLQEIMAKNGLSLSKAWFSHCTKALNVDMIDGRNYTLTNTWVACSYAIQDAIYRKEGGDGFEPVENWHFWSSEKRRQWEMQTEHSRMFMK